VYFNRELFFSGEILKVVVFTPTALRHRDLQLKMLSLDSSVEDWVEVDWIDDPKLNNGEGNSSFHFHMLSVNTAKYHSWGEIVLQVWLSNVSDESGKAFLLGEHVFQVLSRKKYVDLYKSVFGTEWDYALYWDSLDPADADRLLRGWPLDDLLSLTSNDFVLNGETLYDLLGPIITIFMAKPIGQLPFKVEYQSYPRPTQLPHIDLTKLLWLLSALAPCWADVCFFSSIVKMVFGASNEEFFLQLHLDEKEQHDESVHWWKATSDEIQRRAYEIFLYRGGTHGRDVEDWIQAERELMVANMVRALDSNSPHIFTAIVDAIVQDSVRYTMDWGDLKLSVNALKSPAGQQITQD
jgi:hypothetical protein